MPVLTIVLSDLAGNEIAAGSGLATFLRTLAGSFATSITTYMWGHRAIIHHSQLTEHFTPYNPSTASLTEQLGHGDMHIAAAQIERLIQQQAYQISFNEIMHALGILFLVLIAVLWLAKPPFQRSYGPKAGGAPAAGH
jgi:DHA2 family multidrug resistance protein